MAPYGGRAIFWRHIAVAPYFYGAIWRFAPYGARIWRNHHMAPSGAIWRHLMEAFKMARKWRHMAPYGANGAICAIWRHFLFLPNEKWRCAIFIATNAMRWRHMAPSGAIYWRHMAPYGAIWRENGAIWRMILYDTIAKQCKHKKSIFSLTSHCSKMFKEIDITGLNSS